VERHRSLLIVADSLVGGLGAVARAHADWFAADGWRVVVAAPALEGGLAADFEPVPLPGTARDPAGMRAAARRLRVLRRSLKAKVVHCHGMRSFAAALVAGFRPFVTLHGSGRVASDPAAYGRVRDAARAAVPILAAGAISAVPDVAGWRFLPHASPRLHSLDRLPFPDADGPPTFAWVGRVDEGKPGDEFVRAIATVARRREVAGVVLGGGDGMARLTALAGGLDAPIEFLGEGDPEPVLARAWALCLFSEHEAVSFAAQEAMWAGRAVVASPLPGLRWLLGPEGSLASGITEATAALDALCDPGRARAAGATAAQRIRTLIDPTDPWPAIAAMYQKRLS
jgi:glycosyltransferase involved in cell wall biosynthesis